MNILDDKMKVNFGGSSEENFEAFIGDRNKAYYLDIWQGFKNSPSKISLNGSAFLFSVFWLVYRKMDSYATILTYILASLLVFEITFHLNFFLSVGLNVLPFIYLGLFGNWHYYKYIEKTNSSIKKKEMDRDFEIQEIIKEGGTNIPRVIPFILFWIFLGVILISISTFLSRLDLVWKLACIAILLIRTAMVFFRDKEVEFNINEIG